MVWITSEVTIECPMCEGEKEVEATTLLNGVYMTLGGKCPSCEGYGTITGDAEIEIDLNELMDGVD